MHTQTKDSHAEFEALVAELNDPKLLEEYKKPYDGYKPAAIPRILGRLLVFLGTIIYGKRPSYLKFRAIEVVARVPYHSWEAVMYTLLTMFYTNEQKALRLSKVAQFARFAQDNETMHVIMISQFAKQEKSNSVTHTIIPLVFAFFYFWASYLLYLIKPRYSLELNYMFEQHAFDQYSEFLERNGEQLKKKPVTNDFIEWYGRHPQNQYEFFMSVRNDEIIHRNRSIRELPLHTGSC